MKNTTLILLALVVLGGFIVISNSAYVINETQQVILTQFGKPDPEPITEPGLHFKIPFLQKANYFDKRFLEWDGDRNQVPTKDKRFIWIDTYARWRVQDPLLFFQRVTNESQAQTRLDDILDSETRNAITRHNLIELIRSTNRQVSSEVDLGEGTNLIADLATVDIGRAKICEEIILAAKPKCSELGIELLDLRFKRIKFVDDVQQKIYERMITERKRIAEKFRSEGQGEASKIFGDKERDLKKIQSEAYKTAEEIRGDADAKATEIYAAAYNRNSESRDFYRFLKTMETYESTLSKDDVLILSTKSDFFRFFDNRLGR